MPINTDIEIHAVNVLSAAPAISCVPVLSRLIRNEAFSSESRHPVGVSPT